MTMAIDRVVVLGASAGGLESLLEVVRALPGDFPAPLLVAMHVAPHLTSLIPDILTRRGKLRAVHPDDGDELCAGRIFVAPPDHHLLIEDGHVGVKKGPRENRFRPSVDALFRSAAYTFREGAIGVILSGELDDGTSGLWTIKRLGGTSIVQQPDDAAFSSMPRSAITQVETDYSVRAADIGPLLAMLARQPATHGEQPEAAFFSRLEAELDIAAGEYPLDRGSTRLGQLSTLTCPECHGSLVRIDEGDMLRFRCHTGHALSAEALAKSVAEDAVQTCEQSMRALEESAMLLEMTGRHFDKAGRRRAAEQYFQRAERACMQARALHGWLMDQEQAMERVERSDE